MAIYLKEPSRTFSEYLLIPGYSSSECRVENVNLSTPLVRFRRGEMPEHTLSIPMVSSIMQSVSNDTLAIALAREGGLSLFTDLNPLKGKRRWSPMSRAIKPDSFPVMPTFPRTIH